MVGPAIWRSPSTAKCSCRGGEFGVARVWILKSAALPCTFSAGFPPQSEYCGTCLPFLANDLPARTAGSSSHVHCSSDVGVSTAGSRSHDHCSSDVGVSTAGSRSHDHGSFDLPSSTAGSRSHDHCSAGSELG